MLNSELLNSIQNYIDKTYKPKTVVKEQLLCSYEIAYENNKTNLKRRDTKSSSLDSLSIGQSLEEELKTLDESFQDSLLRMIDAKGLKDPIVYKKANVDRKLFSKIRSEKNYKPSKSTILALCIGMECNLKETRELLKKAGYALSDSDMGDVIVKYFIVQRIYDLSKVNEALLNYDQKTLTNY